MAHQEAAPVLLELSQYELDDDFCKLMDENIERSFQLSKSSQRLQEQQRAPPPPPRRHSMPDLSGRMSRTLMRYMSQLCLVNLYGDYRSLFLVRKNTSRNNNNNKWPRFVRAAYLYCILKMLLTTYYQYCYDFSLTRYERASAVDQMQDRRELISQEPEATMGKHYEQEVEDARTTLKLLGAPFMNLKFSIENTNIFFLLVSLGLYVQTQLYFAHVRPFDYTLVRSIMNFRAELKLINRSLICVQLNKFIESSRVYANKQLVTGVTGCYCANRVAVANHALTIRQLKRMALAGSLVPANKDLAWIEWLAHTNCLYTLSYLCYCSLIMLILAAALPLQVGVRVESDPMDVLAALEMLFLVLLVNSSSTFWGSVLLTTTLDQVYLVRSLKCKFERFIALNSARLFAARQEMALTALTLQPSYDARSLDVVRQTDDDDDYLSWRGSGLSWQNHENNFYGNLGNLCEFSINSSNLSQQTIEQRIRSAAATGGGYRSLGAQMNADLLELLLSYKIFVVQLAPIKRSYGFVTLTTCTLMILMPLVGRVHVPYVDGRIKLYVGALSILCTIVCDLLILIPVSYLYTRCSKLYKSLSSLLAHATEASSRHVADQANLELQDQWSEHIARQQTSQPFPCYASAARAIYNEHTIEAIRKELSDPDRLVGQFATRVLGARLTYNNLLKIHFWIAFITQSFLFETSTTTTTATGHQQRQPPADFFGSLFFDPFGLF